MSGIHTIQVTYTDGSVRRLECLCQWCDIWRAIEGQATKLLQRRVREMETAVWPEWLGSDPKEDR